LGRLAPRQPPLRIAVVDRSSAFGGGITYSGPVAGETLLQNPVSAMPDSLGAYLRATPGATLAAWAAQSGPVAQRWWHAAEPLIARGEVDDLFVPRGLYGALIEHQLKSVLAEAWPGLQIECMTAEVVGLDRDSEAGPIVAALKDGRALQAETVILGLGIVPGPATPGATSYLDRRPKDFVASLAAQVASRRGPICILGANAASMDVLNLLHTYGDALPEAARICVISPSGQLPIPVESGAGAPPCSQLLADPAPVTEAERLAALVVSDARARRAAGFAPMTLSEDGAVAKIMTCLAAMTPEERARLLQFHGKDLAHVSRRSVPAYHAAADALRAAGRLTLLAGRVDDVVDDGAGLTLTLAGRAERVAAAAVVDCRGGGSLAATPDPLMTSFRTGGLLGAQVNAAGSGIVVDDDLRAAPGLFVIGDLLSGYDGRHGVVWHMQNAPRIETYADALASVLAVDLVDRRATTSR